MFEPRGAASITHHLHEQHHGDGEHHGQELNGDEFVCGELHI
jgi:hypothetical protein